MHTEFEIRAICRSWEITFTKNLNLSYFSEKYKKLRKITWTSISREALEESIIGDENKYLKMSTDSQLHSKVSGGKLFQMTGAVYKKQHLVISDSPWDSKCNAYYHFGY